MGMNGNKNINTREWEWELTSGNGRESEYLLCSHTALLYRWRWERYGQLW